MKKWLLTIVTAVLFIAVLAGEMGGTEVSAATKKGTTSDGFSYKISSKDNTVEITKYKGNKKKLEFPDKINGKKVTKIGKEAVKGNKYVTSVKVPDSVKTVAWDAFNDCQNLTVIKLGKNVAQIGNEDGWSYDAWKMDVGKKFKAFEVSSGNKTFYAEDGVLFEKSKYGDALWLVKCPQAKKGEYSVPEGVNSLRLVAFHKSQLSSVTIPAAVESIVSFSYNDNNYSSNIEEYVVEAGNEHYYSKDGVLFQKDDHMYGKRGDLLLHYPQEKKDSFYQVSQETAIIKEHSFDGQKHLEKVEIADAILQNGAFQRCKELEHVVVNGTPCNYAFADCEKLTEVELKNTPSIGAYAFYGSGLKNIILPESVKRVGRYALKCDSLNWVEIQNKDCTFDDLYIGKINKTIIYGYKGSTAEKLAERAGQEFRLIGEPRPEDSHQGTITKETIKLSQTSYTYDGKEKKPKVTVKDKYGKTISKSWYSVKYKNNKNVGEATVKIQFSKDGWYAGTIQTTFVITPPKSKITKLTAGKNDITLQWKGVKASQINGYEIQYSTSDKFDGDNTWNVRINKKDAVKNQIKNLDSKKTYYVRIRSYKNIKREGKTERLYSKWSDKKIVKTL